MITSISWIPKGGITNFVRLEMAEPPSQEEIDQIIKSGGALHRIPDTEEEDEKDMEVESDKEVDEIAHASAAAQLLGHVSYDISEAFKKLDMENYDEEDSDIQLLDKGLCNSYYLSNDMDPYLKDNGEDSEEEEDMIIKPDDLVIVCARHNDQLEIGQLEVYITDEAENGSPKNHHIDISPFPLCTAWLDCPLKGGEKGNFIAVGSKNPAVEIWDLDIINEVQPVATLGGRVEKKKSIKYKKGSHRGHVMGLAWNKEFRNLLASASSDKLVKIWDIATQKCINTMDHHTDKVQAVAWNRQVPEILLSGSFDSSVVLKDVRKPSHSGYKWSVGAEVECLAWDPHAEHSFVVSLDNGMIQGFDIRIASSDPEAKQKPSFTLHAHDKDKAVCSISYNPAAPNLLATGSEDKTVKLWDLSNFQPSCVASRNPRAGMVFSVSFCDDKPFLLAIGGQKGKLQVWDTLCEDAIAQKYRCGSSS